MCSDFVMSKASYESTVMEKIVRKKTSTVVDHGAITGQSNP